MVFSSHLILDSYVTMVKIFRRCHKVQVSSFSPLLFLIRFVFTRSTPEENTDNIRSASFKKRGNSVKLEELSTGPDSPELAAKLKELGVLYYVQGNHRSVFRREPQLLLSDTNVSVLFFYYVIMLLCISSKEMLYTWIASFQCTWIRGFLNRVCKTKITFLWIAVNLQCAVLFDSTAETLFKRALKIREKFLPADHSDLGQ